jgi:L-fuculose-phosphate aldolase
MNPSEEIVAVGRRLYERGYIVAREGNLSVRSGDSLYFTPSGVCKGFLAPDAVLQTDLQGNVIQGRGKPSSEAPMHLEVYKLRPDVGAVIHAHPVYATALAAAGVALDQPVLPEVIVTLGPVPLAPYGAPGTEELSGRLRALIPDHDGVLLANHGALTYGKDLQTAYFRMETLERFAHVLFVARMLGGERLLGSDRVAELRNPID